MAEALKPLSIRPMRIEDLPQVIEIDRASFAMPWSDRTYRYELTRNQAAELFVAEREGTIIGYIGTWQIIDECHISTLAVDTRHRRQGIAKSLIEHALRRAVAKGISTATLEVRVTNEAAIDLYRQFEFEITGRRRSYYRDNGEDAYIMTAEKIPQLTTVEGTLGRS